jgi:hypothetical protein
MAITSNTYTGTGTDKLFSITFPYLDTADVDVYLNGTLQTITTQYTFANATTVEFVTAPANGATILLDRSTDDTDLQATFFPGSAIKAADLNLDFDQVLYIAQETANEAATATSTAATATTTANTALSQSAAAVSTANTASTNASNAVTTANSAVSTANTATTTANSAVSTANTASSNASAAVSTANTASGNASAAVSTANTASSNASAAVSTANTASSNATAAISTANTASTNASNAVTTANSAVTTADNAVTTADSAQTAANNAVVTSNLADTKANQAIAAVAASINYTLVANVAAIPASPANGTYIEVADSTGIESFTPLVGLPGGFIGDSGLTVRLVYQTSNTSWNWLTYFANNSETRYLKLAGGTLTGALAHPLGAAATPSITFTGDTNTGIYSPGADQVAISTNGQGRLYVDASGRILAGTASSSIGGSGSIVLQGSAGPGVVRAAFGGTSPGSTDILGAITFTDSSHTGAAYIYGSRDGGTWTSTTSQPSAITFGTTPNGSGTAFERLRITSAGLVGVGVSAPGSKLHIGGEINPIIRINTSENSDTWSTTSDYGKLQFFSQDYEYGGGGEMAAIAVGVGNIYGATPNLRFYVSNPSGGAANPTQRMILDSAGRLGIGSSAPGNTLHVNSGNIGLGKYSDQAAATRFVGITGTSGFESVFAAGLGITTTVANQSQDVFLQSHNFGVGYNSLILKADGKVGIGTTLVGNSANQLSVRRDSANNIVDALLLNNGSVDNAAGTGVRINFSGVQESNSDIRYAYIESATSSIGNDHYIAFGTNAGGATPVERARIDSSGRLLIGTSSSPSLTDGQYSKLHVIGNSNSATGNGFINIGRGLAASGALAGGTGLGVLQFTDNAGAVHAAISGDTDATTGTNDYPGRLVFSTTADGAASPTERFRITSTGAQFSVIPGGSTIYPQFACRVWVNFDGQGTFSPNPGTSNIRASGNVSSIFDNGTGSYTVNFATAMPDANYACVVSVSAANETQNANPPAGVDRTASSVRIDVESAGGGQFDAELINFAIFR